MYSGYELLMSNMSVITFTLSYTFVAQPLKYLLPYIFAILLVCQKIIKLANSWQDKCGRRKQTDHKLVLIEILLAKILHGFFHFSIARFSEI